MTLDKQIAVRNRVRRYVENSKAENTMKAYRLHWKEFDEFCKARGYIALPAEPGAVVDFLTYAADAGCKVSTIRVKAAAISYMHRIQKQDNPCLQPEVRETLQGIRRTLGTKQVGKEAATLDIIKKLLPMIPDDLRGKRDKAMILVGFVGAFRRSELVTLTVEDIEFHAETGAILTVRHSKTDQEGQGMTKALPWTANKEICPVTALIAWLGASGATTGPIFRRVDKWGNVGRTALKGKEVERTIKKYAEAAGLDPAIFSGHSLRAGFVTEAAGKDVATWQIMQQTGHKSSATLQRYIRDHGKGAATAAAMVLGD